MKKAFLSLILPLTISTGATLIALVPMATPVAAQSTQAARNHPDLDTRVRTDKTQYEPDSAVEIRLTMVNRGKQTLRLTPPRRTGGYTITITQARSGRFIWQMLAPVNAAPNPLLPPDESFKFTELWDQRDFQGNEVPSGVYNIEVNFYGQSVRTQVYLTEGRANANSTNNNAKSGGNTGETPGQGVYAQPSFPSPPSQPFSIPGGIPISTTVVLPGAPTTLFSASVSCDRQRVHPGERVKLTYRICNDGPSNCSYRFNSGKQCDFDICDSARKSNHSIWRYSDEIRYAQSFTQISLNPHESQTFTAYWNVPKTCAVGTYRVNAYLTPRGAQQAESSTCTIEVY